MLCAMLNFKLKFKNVVELPITLSSVHCAAGIGGRPSLVRRVTNQRRHTQPLQPAGGTAHVVGNGMKMTRLAS